jgi:hypothetical protein
VPTIWERRPDDVITTYLGQFDRVTANAVAERLEEAGIVWWYKEPGIISVVWEFGVRLFVDRERLEEAQAIVDDVGTGAITEADDGPALPGT